MAKITKNNNNKILFHRAHLFVKYFERTLYQRRAGKIPHLPLLTRLDKCKNSSPHPPLTHDGFPLSLSNFSPLSRSYSHSHKTASSIFVWAAYLVNHVHWLTCLARLSMLTQVLEGFREWETTKPYDPMEGNWSLVQHELTKQENIS